MSDELYTDIVLIALQNQKRLPKINHNIFLHNLGSIGFFKKKSNSCLKSYLEEWDFAMDVANLISKYGFVTSTLG